MLALAIGLVVLGVLLVCRELRIWPGDALVFPVAAVAAGACVLWASSAGAARSRRSRAGSGHGSAEPQGVRRLLTARAVTGVVLVLFGLVAYTVGGVTGEGLITVVVALGFAVGGTALVFGPWLRRLLGDLDDERRERIRSEERAEVAAHLHDSVLQTLALIQRGAAQNRTHEVAYLARRQERELRAWLYGDRGAPAVTPEGAVPDRLAGAVAAMAGDVEADHAVTVDVVVVGDGPVDGATHGAAGGDPRGHRQRRQARRRVRGVGVRGGGRAGPHRLRPRPRHRVRSGHGAGRSPRHRPLDPGPHRSPRRAGDHHHRARPGDRGRAPRTRPAPSEEDRP